MGGRARDVVASSVNKGQLNLSSARLIFARELENVRHAREAQEISQILSILKKNFRKTLDNIFLKFRKLR